MPAFSLNSNQLRGESQIPCAPEFLAAGRNAGTPITLARISHHRVEQATVNDAGTSEESGPVDRPPEHPQEKWQGEVCGLRGGGLDRNAAKS